MITVEELIAKLDKDYELLPKDLLLDEADRNRLYGKLELIEEIKELNEMGVEYGEK